MTKADRAKIESWVRLSYPIDSKGLHDTDAVVYKNRGKEQIIMPGKWWINKNTPVGDDAELWKQMPWNGRQQLYFDNILAIYREIK